MFCMLKRKNISCLRFKKILKRQKQLILLMISNREKWYYIVVKKLSALLIGIARGMIFTAWIVLILSEQKANLIRKKICENTDFCSALVPSEDTETLEFTRSLIKHHLLFMPILNLR